MIGSVLCGKDTYFPLSCSLTTGNFAIIEGGI